MNGKHKQKTVDDLDRRVADRARATISTGRVRKRWSSKIMGTDATERTTDTKVLRGSTAGRLKARVSNWGIANPQNTKRWKWKWKRECGRAPKYVEGMPWNSCSAQGNVYV